MLEPRTIPLTADVLCREAYEHIAGQEPTAQQLDRAVKIWVDLLLTDIWDFATHQDITRFKVLENSATIVLTKGRRRYDWPEDFHRAIAATLLTGTIAGTVATNAIDGDTDLICENTGGLEDYVFTTGYELSGRYLVMTAGEAANAMREIVSAETLDTPTRHSFALDEPWMLTELPAEGNAFMIATERGRWIDEEMREYMDEFTSRPGLAMPLSFNDHDETLELDVAPDSASYALLLRYWSNPTKINKESSLMRKLIGEWRVALWRGIAWMTCDSIDDNRAVLKKKEYEEARLALVEKDYDRGPRFAGFRPG